jgi:hypothetical protein
MNEQLDNQDTAASELEDQDRQAVTPSPNQSPSTTSDSQRKPDFVIRQDRLRRDCKRLRRQRSQGY